PAYPRALTLQKIWAGEKANPAVASTASADPARRRVYAQRAYRVVSPKRNAGSLNTHSERPNSFCEREARSEFARWLLKSRSVERVVHSGTSTKRMAVVSSSRVRPRVI